MSNVNNFLVYIDLYAIYLWMILLYFFILFKICTPYNFLNRYVILLLNWKMKTFSKRYIPFLLPIFSSQFIVVTPLPERHPKWSKPESNLHEWWVAVLWNSRLVGLQVILWTLCSSLSNEASCFIIYLLLRSCPWYDNS